MDYNSKVDVQKMIYYFIIYVLPSFLAYFMGMIFCLEQKKYRILYYIPLAIEFLIAFVF